jgi:hypothetical protein
LGGNRKNGHAGKYKTRAGAAKTTGPALRGAAAKRREKSEGFFGYAGSNG